jgi:Tol biopolymer transport system component
VMIALATMYFLLKPNGSTSLEPLNPNMTQRVLSIPFSQVSYPGISPDGYWIAFPAPDANNKWDIYYMHVSSSDPRRITTDSCSLGTDLIADISPDGSQVTYSRYSSNGVYQLCVTSALGGVRKILSDSSHLGRWRPDGERIGTIRVNKPSKKAFYNLWSVKPDGSDSRLEFADTLGCAGGRYSFAWSPDGESMAWIRSFKEGYQEVITVEIATGKEKQLTFDKKNIDDVYWTRKDVIVFSSNRAGNTNLWVVPVAGGSPQQITKGGGPDIGISMSADGQKLVYLQQQRISNVWVANVDGSSARQVTFDDREIPFASLSPDGEQIALAMTDMDPLKPSVHLFLQDRNGANRRQVTVGDTIVGYVRWSPDGKRIAFSMSSVTDPLGNSANMCIVDAANPGIPKSIIAGNFAVWLNLNTLVASRRNAAPCEEITLEGGPAKRFFEDSTQAFPFASGKKIVYEDRRKGKEGAWIISADYVTNAAKSRPKRLFGPDEIRQAGFSANYFYYWNKRGELWRLNCSTEGKERVKGQFPGLTAGDQIFVREDDKEFLYIPFKLSGKLVLIENLFL